MLDFSSIACETMKICCGLISSNSHMTIGDRSFTGLETDGIQEANSSPAWVQYILVTAFVKLLPMTGIKLGLLETNGATQLYILQNTNGKFEFFFSGVKFLECENLLSLVVQAYMFVVAFKLCDAASHLHVLFTTIGSFTSQIRTREFGVNKSIPWDSINNFLGSIQDPLCSLCDSVAEEAASLFVTWSDDRDPLKAVAAKKIEQSAQAKRTRRREKPVEHRSNKKKKGQEEEEEEEMRE